MKAKEKRKGKKDKRKKILKTRRDINVASCWSTRCRIELVELRAPLSGGRGRYGKLELSEFGAV